MKRQKDVTLKDELPRSVGIQYTTGKRREVATERMRKLSYSGNDTKLWFYLVVKVKSNAIKNNTAKEPGTLGP